MKKQLALLALCLTTSAIAQPVQMIMCIKDSNVIGVVGIALVNDETNICSDTMSASTKSLRIQFCEMNVGKTDDVAISCLNDETEGS